MKILLVYPSYPKTYWSFYYALKFISKKASFPPLGLMTIAGMLPDEWEKRLIDMNVDTLREKDILWADYVFISAMAIQTESAVKVIEQCKSLGKKVAAGGPLFTCEYEKFDVVDYLVLNEGEITLTQFIKDLKNGQPRHIYTSDEWADLEKAPVPLWNLIKINKYATMSIQYSRGCPFNCDFCNITSLYGHKPRTKSKTQLIEELDALYKTGWRGGVFFVDDNFIGNKRKLKEEILPAIINWMNKRKYPFSFMTEASINLSDDEELMHLMVQAGFHTVFIGIETTNEDSLLECNKLQNKDRDLVACVKKIQKSGLQVQGGFIVGFDSDNIRVFDKLVVFIQESGIAAAMVGLLNAPKGTNLHKRLSEEGRLLNEISGDNTDFTMNFIPKMNYETLIKGYKKIVDTIYSPSYYYNRVKVFLKEYSPYRLNIKHFRLNYITAFFKSIFRLGIIGIERQYYWKLFFWTLFRRPRAFGMALTLSIYGFHFRKIYEDSLVPTKS